MTTGCQSFKGFWMDNKMIAMFVKVARYTRDGERGGVLLKTSEKIQAYVLYLWIDPYLK